MSLRINTNVAATISTLGSLDATNSTAGSGASRLGRSPQTASAANDTVRLSALDGTKAEAKSLVRSYGESQDAISVAKTAHGAVDQAQSLLSDLRTLAAQAADSGDSQNVKAQVSSTLSSIDRIATTQWNGTTLLDGTAGSVRSLAGTTTDGSADYALPDVRTRSLGKNAETGESLADIDLSTPDGAYRALGTIDDAIAQLSLTRGDLGAFQRGVLSSHANAPISEAATSAASRIVGQSGTAALAQANLVPQQVLKLLQG